MTNITLCQLLGRIPLEIVRGGATGPQLPYTSPQAYVSFFFKDAVFTLRHRQECCEKVTLEHSGVLQDLVGLPILVAEERVNLSPIHKNSSETWTFYTFRNLNSSVDLVWKGESNGHYSESVDHYWDALSGSDTPLDALRKHVTGVFLR